MKAKVRLYTILRISFGVLLLIQGVYNVFYYIDYLTIIDKIFRDVTFFDIVFFEATVPLIPFEQFVVWVLLTMGIFTRKVLYFGVLLFSFLGFFLIAANLMSCAIINFGLLLTSLFLLKYDEYKVNTIGYEKDSYLTIF